MAKLLWRNSTVLKTPPSRRKLKERYLADRKKREAAVVGRTPLRNDMDRQFFAEAQAVSAERDRQVSAAERAKLAGLSTEQARNNFTPAPPVAPTQVRNAAQPTMEAVAPSIAPDQGENR